MILRRRILLRVSGLLTTMIVAVTALICAFAVKYQRTSIKDIFGAQLAVLADRVEQLVLWDDRVALKEMLGATVSDHDIVEYAFIERRGRTYVHTFGKGIPKALLGLPMGSPGTPVVRELESEQGRRLFDMAMPINGEQAVLHLGLSSEAIDRQALAPIPSVILLGALAIALGVILAGATAGLITREVDQTTNALRSEIAERKQAQQELARYRDHLEELVRRRTRELEESQARMRQVEQLASIGNFAAGVAHEINNPLASILSSAQYALRPGRDRGILERALQEIAEDTGRCARVVSDVLQFARQVRFEKQTVNLNDIVQRAAELTRNHAQQRGVRLELGLSESLPSVTGNPAGLEQVSVNVINNAIEASSEGQQVVLQTEHDSDTVRFCVQDSGRGMSDEEKQHAFDPFFTTRVKEGGSGIGLSIAHGYVTVHGGTISINTQLGRGTVITIEFPMSLPSTDTDAQ